MDRLPRPAVPGQALLFPSSDPTECGNRVSDLTARLVAGRVFDGPYGSRSRLPALRWESSAASEARDQRSGNTPIRASFRFQLERKAQKEF